MHVQIRFWDRRHRHGEMKAKVKAVRPIFRLLCCRRGLRKIIRGLRPRNFNSKKAVSRGKKFAQSLRFESSIYIVAQTPCRSREECWI